MLDAVHPNLTGQVAIITGGGSGIGQITALALASAGAMVAVVDRFTGDTVAAIEAHGGSAVAHTVDVTDQHATEQMVHEIEQQFGVVDLLFNNAGIGTPSLGATWEVDPDVWWRTLDVNLRGQFLCARAVLPAMIRRRQGRIINMSSGLAWADAGGNSAYSASKAAIARFTGCLADETRTYNVAVFAVQPGLVRTALTEGSALSNAALAGQEIGLGLRIAFEEGYDEPPDRCARLVLQLASGKADALSGRFVDIYDDIDELIARVDEITCTHSHGRHSSVNPHHRNCENQLIVVSTMVQGPPSLVLHQATISL